MPILLSFEEHHAHSALFRASAPVSKAIALPNFGRLPGCEGVHERRHRSVWDRVSLHRDVSVGGSPIEPRTEYAFEYIRVGLLVDSEIVLSTRYGKTMVFINKTSSTETAYQQDLVNRDLLSTRLIVGKVGPGMWCGKFNSTSNVLVCETQRKVNMYGCVSE